MKTKKGKRNDKKETKKSWHGQGSSLKPSDSGGVDKLIAPGMQSL